MRAVPDSLDPVVVAEIDRRLAEVSATDDVTIPWAIESGSRAWGFPSPDSDYDCRFIYVRSPAQYLSLWPSRDVIETPLDKVFDVNGWDLAKAIQLMVRGNATVVEWLQSPIVYSGDPAFRDGMLGLAERVGSPALVGRHYAHLGRDQLAIAELDGRLKKLFYALRPAAALRWLRQHPESVIVPMNLLEIMGSCEMPPGIVEETERLIERKAETREAGAGTIPESIRQFVADELALGLEHYEDADGRVPPAAFDEADAYFRLVISGH